MLIGEGAVLLLRADRDFQRVYHVAESQAALGAALGMLPPSGYVTDLVGNADGLEAVRATYARSGFEAYGFLQRMSRANAGEPCPGGDVLVATAADAAETHAFLERLLDPLVEQIPTVDELRQEAAAGHLLLVRREGAILGMLMFALKGVTGHLRFWHVDDTARGEGVGRRLLAGFFERCARARRLVLWVVGDNDRSIAIYRHYGFSPDGLLDQVMIQRRER